MYEIKFKLGLSCQNLAQIQSKLTSKFIKLNLKSNPSIKKMIVQIHSNIDLDLDRISGNPSKLLKATRWADGTHFRPSPSHL